MKKVLLLMSMFAFLFVTVISAQNYSISGTITDATNGQPLIGANVYIASLNKGSITDLAGKYKINGINAGTYELTVSYVGYESQTRAVEFNGNKSVDFKLTPTSLFLGETVVSGSRATYRETPVAFSEIKAEEVEAKLASRDVPHVLQTTPSVYVSDQGGGAGDARINVRGFDQRNTAVMINGVPVNDMENGWVYWSNWAGLGDVTANIQIQRGLGASPYSVSAVGGVLNMQTKNVGNSENFVKVKSEYGSDNLQKYSLAFSTDLIPNQVGLTALVSRKTWDGYADATWLREFTYFFSLGGVFGDHSLELQAVGSPQRHGQRSRTQSIETWEERGKRYNSEWGYYRGGMLNLVENFYHKPAFNLNWNWQLAENTVLSNVAYLSTGTGGGTGSFGARFNRTEDGIYDFDAAAEANRNNIVDGEAQSLSIIRASRNDHTWYGLLSTIKQKFTDNLFLDFGFDGRYYKGVHFREITNLLGGDYFLNDDNKNRDPNTKLRIDDKIGYYNDGLVRQYGGFGQLEYKTDFLSTFVNLSASNTDYKRIDYFLPNGGSDAGLETDWEAFFGYTAKTGLNLNITESSNIFGNVGYFSKAPLFRNVFTFTNELYDNLDNEKILGFELGYGYRTSFVAVNINGYLTSWKNKSFTRSFTPEGGEQLNYNIAGANALHRGVELEATVAPMQDLEFRGMLSYGTNTWENNVTSRVSPDNDPTQVDEFTAYAKGLYVGDFPMTTAALGADYKIPLSATSRIYINPVYKFFGRYYANFDPDRRTDPAEEGVNSWRLPDYSIVDFHAGYDMRLNSLIQKVNIGFHVFNLLNNDSYIIDATDGRDHTAESASVYFGRERWYNVSVALEF